MPIITYIRSIGLKSLFLFVLMLFLFTGCASMPTHDQLTNADYGPYPENYEQRITDYFSNILIDPYSAQYRFHRPYQGWIKKAPILGGGVDQFGWMVRVWVNAKNRFGGYVGEKHHMFFFRNGIMKETGYVSSYHEPYFQDPNDIHKDKGRIGTVINKEGYILSVIKNSPAFNAGIQEGDRLIKVNDHNIQTGNAENIQSEIVGEPNTKVKLTILRNNQELILEMERQIIPQ